MRAGLRGRLVHHKLNFPVSRLLRKLSTDVYATCILCLDNHGDGHGKFRVAVNVLRSIVLVENVSVSAGGGNCLTRSEIISFLWDMRSHGYDQRFNGHFPRTIHRTYINLQRILINLSKTPRLACEALYLLTAGFREWRFSGQVTPGPSKGCKITEHCVVRCSEKD